MLEWQIITEICKIVLNECLVPFFHIGSGINLKHAGQSKMSYTALYLTTKAKKPTNWWDQVKNCATQLENAADILNIIDGSLQQTVTKSFELLVSWACFFKNTLGNSQLHSTGYQK